MTDRLQYHHEAINAHLEAIEHLSRAEGRNELVGPKESICGTICLYRGDRILEKAEFASKDHRMEIIKRWRLQYHVPIVKGYYYTIQK